MDNQAFGGRIKALRGQESRPVFAKRFGFSLDTIVRYESGKTFPGADFISKLCHEYNVSADWLLFGVQSKEESPPMEKAGGDFKDELLNLYRKLNDLTIKLDQSRKRKDDYQAQLIGIREKIEALLELNHDRFKEFQVAVSVEGKEKTQALADVLTELESMADDLYVGRGDRRISKL